MKHHEAAENSTPDSVAEDQTCSRHDAAPDHAETHRREWHTHVDGFAVASLVCSLLGFLTGLGALVGIAFGLIARKRIKQSESLSGRGLALWGIVIGLVALATTTSAITFLVRHHSGRPATDAVVSGTPKAHEGLAEQELLVPSDYPAAWWSLGARSSTFDGFSTAQVAAMERCVRPLGVDTAPVEDASQLYVDSNSHLFVTDTVDVFPTTADAVADISAELNSRFPACNLPNLNPPSQFVTSWYDVGRITMTGPISVIYRSISPTGTLALDLEVSVSFRATKTGSGVLHVDEITVEKGRSESNVWITNLDSPVPISLANRMAHAAAIRLKN